MIFGKKKKEIPFLYELKESLVTDTEMEYLECIESILPEGYLVLPQANLAAFITRTDQARYRGELFRNIDFIVTDLDYCPVFLIEINDQTHLAQERRERDRKVADICEEAGIPLITFWRRFPPFRQSGFITFCRRRNGGGATLPQLYMAPMTVRRYGCCGGFGIKFWRNTDGEEPLSGFIMQSARKWLCISEKTGCLEKTEGVC